MAYPKDIPPAIFERLTEREREILELRFLQKMTYRQIAAHLGLSSGEQVRQIMSKAMNSYVISADSATRSTSD